MKLIVMLLGLGVGFLAVAEELPHEKFGMDEYIPDVNCQYAAHGYTQGSYVEMSRGVFDEDKGEYVSIKGIYKCVEGGEWQEHTGPIE